MSGIRLAARLLWAACGAIAVLLLGMAEGRGQAVRIDAAKFIDHTLPDCGLQKAIDSVPKGGTLVIPRGTYLLRRSLVLKEHVTVSGVGPETVLTVQPLLPCSLLAGPADKGAK